MKSNFITIAINGIKGTSFMFQCEVSSYITDKIDKVVCINRREREHGVLTDNVL